MSPVSVFTHEPAVGSCQRKIQLGPLLEPAVSSSTLVSLRASAADRAAVKRQADQLAAWLLDGQERIVGDRNLGIDDAAGGGKNDAAAAAGVVEVVSRQRSRIDDVDGPRIVQAEIGDWSV